MIRPEDIGSLTDFCAKREDSSRSAQANGPPELLTVNGKAEVVVQNAAAYQRLIESLEKFKRERREEG